MDKVLKSYSSISIRRFMAERVLLNLFSFCVTLEKYFALWVNFWDRAPRFQFEHIWSNELCIIDCYWSYWRRFTVISSRLNWSRKTRPFYDRDPFFLRASRLTRLRKLRSNLFRGRPSLLSRYERYLRMIHVFMMPCAKTYLPTPGYYVCTPAVTRPRAVTLSTTLPETVDIFVYVGVAPPRPDNATMCSISEKRQNEVTSCSFDESRLVVCL